MTKWLLLCFLFSAHTAFAADVSSDDMNSSNNPLTPSLAVNLQDYIASSVYGTDETANTFLLRAASPIMLEGPPQLVRVTLPFSTVPDPEGTGTVSGVGDLNIFDIFLLGSKDLQFGIGPYLVAPTASKDATGAGKWQLGLSGLTVAPFNWGLVGVLMTYQHDLGGNSDRPTQNIFTMQPFVMYNLPAGFYLRTTGIWNFDWQTGKYYMPIGFGGGKVWKAGQTVINAYVEPQWTVAHEGDGAPNYQTFIGLNFQFPLK
jgi:hypothetical protein